MARPLLSFNKCRKSLLSSLETFFCRNLKNSECHFWADVMLRQSRHRASRNSPAQKSQDLRMVCSKNFSRATFFVFWSTQMVNIYLSYLRMKQISWKSAVWVCSGFATNYILGILNLFSINQSLFFTIIGPFWKIWSEAARFFSFLDNKNESVGLITISLIDCKIFLYHGNKSSHFYL